MNLTYIEKAIAYCLIHDSSTYAKIKHILKPCMFSYLLAKNIYKKAGELYEKKITIDFVNIVDDEITASRVSELVSEMCEYVHTATAVHQYANKLIAEKRKIMLAQAKTEKEIREIEIEYMIEEKKNIAFHNFYDLLIEAHEENKVVKPEDQISYGYNFLDNKLGGINKGELVLLGGITGCFVKDTKVLMENNIYKNIQDVKIGEKVASLNTDKKIIEYKNVLNTFIFGGKMEGDKLVKLTLKNGTTITGTDKHELYIGGNWVRLDDIVRRKVEADSRNGRKVLCFKYGEIDDNKMEGWIKEHCNISSIRQKRIYENNVETQKWEDKNNKSSQDYCFDMDTKSNVKTMCQSFKFQQIGQQNREFRMGYLERKFSLQQEKWKDSLFRWSRPLCEKIERIKSSFNKTYRRASEGNTRSIYSIQEHKENVSEEILCDRIKYKRYFGKKNLEAREISLDEIINAEIFISHEYVYDLNVADNNNYVITENNIIVHNTGKSTFASIIAQNAFLNNKKAVVVSLEERRVTKARKAIFYYCNAKRKNNGKKCLYMPFYLNGKQKFTVEEEEEAIQKLASSVEFVGADEKISINEIEEVFKRGADLYVFDHLHYFGIDSKDDSRANAIEHAMQKIKDLTIKYDTRTILVAHFQKIDESKRPTMTNFKDSISIAQTADTIIMLWRDKSQSSEESTQYETEFIVPKNRIDVPAFTAKSYYNPETSKYSDEVSYSIGTKNSYDQKEKRFHDLTNF